MIAFMYRNVLVFLKDKIAVLFSFLAVFVVYFLYLCFLKDAMLTDLEPQFPTYGRELCNTWVIAGTVGILTLTSSLSVMGILISDRSRRLLSDFQLTYLSPCKLTIGYIISTTLITFFIALCALGIGECYILNDGGTLISVSDFVKISGILIVSIASCTSFLFCFLIWFKSTSSFSNITTIVGTLSGFLMGIYLPIGVLPSFLQAIIRYFPFSHGTAMLRQVMMEKVMENAFVGNEAMQSSFEEHFGLFFQYGGLHFEAWMSTICLILLTVIFCFIGCQMMKYVVTHE